MLLEQQNFSQKSAQQALEKLRTRLLDLTARNSLINFKHSKRRSLRIIDEQPNQLVETLLSEIEMNFLPVPEPTRQELIAAGYIKIDDTSGQEIRVFKEPTAEEWAQHLGFVTSYEVPKISSEENTDKYTDAAIQTLLYPYELEVRLKNLMQISESGIQEMGANILYLAFGFLEWFENDDTSRIAPLFLVPVRLQKGQLDPETKTYKYVISYSGEDIIPNLSLREKLRADFAMALPNMDENTNPELYFDEVINLIEKNQPKWKVRRFITLALLNFSKLLMYLDLDPSNWPEESNIIEHPIVGPFLSGYDTEQTEDDINQDFGFGEEYLIDEIDDINIKYPLIDDADSSQHSALIDAVDGKNLVIEGPPGTGKSQTITNLIAAAIAQGKRVLFVAEKLAALEVVRRRLDIAGLGEFCLELHSHKSQKHKVLNEIESRLNKHGHYRRPKDIDIDIARYEELKTSLISYVKKINQPWKNTGKTLHEIFMAATRYREVFDINPDVLCFESHNGDVLDVMTQRRIDDQVKAFRKVYLSAIKQINDGSKLRQHPWYGVCNIDLQIFDIDKVKSALSDWQISLNDLINMRGKIIDELDLGQSEVTNSINELLILVDNLESLPLLKGDEILDLLPILQGGRIDELQKYLDLFENAQSIYMDLEKKVGKDVLKDFSIINNLIKGGESLTNFANKAVQLKELSKAIKKLTEIQRQLSELDGILKATQDALGEDASNYLSATKSGLMEFKSLIDLLGSINFSYLKLRDDRFDNDEMDELVPKMHSELEQIHILENELEDLFQLDHLPSKSELQKIKNTLDMGGAFRWFKSRWRIARKKILDLAKSNQFKFKKLYSLLDKVIEFSNRYQELNENNNYKEVFGENMKGTATDLAAIETLRNWYKKVRQQYGVGFAQKNPLGNALFKLPIDSARSIRSLYEQGVSGQLSNLINDLSSLQNIFKSVSELENDQVLLIGDESIIFNLLKRLSETMDLCDPLMTDDTITVSELVNRIEQFHCLNELVIKLENMNVDKQLFRGKINLEIEGNIDNSNSLRILRDTLVLAIHIDQKLINDAIRQYIYENPNVNTFNLLEVLVKDLKKSLLDQSSKYEVFSAIVKLNSDNWMNESGDQLNELINRNDQALGNCDSLQNWLDYVRVRNQTIDMGLDKLIIAVEQGNIEINQINDAHKMGMFDILAREILREEPELSCFSGHTQEALINQFKEYDVRLKKLQREKISWQIDQVKIPTGSVGARVSEYTELALLRHECGKKKRHIPVRQLLKRAGKALVALKPCFMMGPMSVAQYLEPGEIEFDLLVMDEASQIKPQDSLGVIARASQLVVVGDPKQLPPTSFFDRVVDDDDDDPTAIEESESILDATRSIFPARRLRWHYRSQHEKLIAFSNHWFYDNDLILFPSPYRGSTTYGIQYIEVSRGCFVNKRNMEEARMISEAVREHFKRNSGKSLGIVAMNNIQRLQIENAIEALSKDDNVFQQCLEHDSHEEEPLFC